MSSAFLLGGSGSWGLLSVGCERPWLNDGLEPGTVRLEFCREELNSLCIGGMCIYRDEHDWRRQVSGPLLTLRSESVGSEQD